MPDVILEDDAEEENSDDPPPIKDTCSEYMPSSDLKECIYQNQQGGLP